MTLQTNVLIDDDGIPKLCDFGIAHIIFEGPTGMTTTSEHTGTERYLAPELVAADEGTRPTSASDVYAMGCLGLHVSGFCLKSKRFRTIVGTFPSDAL
jgi:serine/threonine protein kinase